MPFKRPGEEPPKHNPEPPLITDEMRLRWMLMDAERYRREDAEKARVVAEAERIVREKAE